MQHDLPSSILWRIIDELNSDPAKNRSDIIKQVIAMKIVVFAFEDRCNSLHYFANT